MLKFGVLSFLSLLNCKRYSTQTPRVFRSDLASMAAAACAVAGSTFSFS